MFPDLTRDDVFRIETRRLWLRWPRARDAGAVLRLAGERQVAEMTARIPHPLPRAEVDAFLIGARAGNAAGTGLTLALSQRSDPAGLVGIVGLFPGADGPPELGYWLGRPYWGAGLMAEAARALVDAYFAYAGGRRLPPRPGWRTRPRGGCSRPAASGTQAAPAGPSPLAAATSRSTSTASTGRAG